MQLYSVEQQRSQALEAHAAAFGTLKVRPGALIVRHSPWLDSTDMHAIPPPSQHSGNAEASQLIAFAKKALLPGGQTESKLHIIELGAKPGSAPFAKRTVDLFFPPDFADDFPVSMQVSDKFGFVFVVTKLGLLFVYDLETGAALYRNRISMENVFLTAERAATGGFLVLTRGGKVLSVEVNSPALVPFITGTLQNPDLALAIASRCGLPGAEQLILPRFEALFAAGDYKAAADVAASSPSGILRTRETVARFQGAPAAVGAQPPLLVYFRECLSRGKLNGFESFELAKLVLQQNKRPLLDTWLAEEKLECTEELGDMVFATGPDGAETALKVYVRARAHGKVAAALAAAGQADKLAAYCEQTGYTPNVMDMLARTVAVNPAAALQLALSTTAKQGAPPSDINAVADLFLQRAMVREATSFLLEALKPNLAEHGALQTKVLEINLLQFPTVADAILAQGALTHYDAPRVAQLCEKAGLYSRALQHYTDLADIKRVVVNTHAIPPEALVEFFGSLRADWALECLHELLAVNARANLQVRCCRAHRGIGCPHVLSSLLTGGGPDCEGVHGAAGRLRQGDCPAGAVQVV